MREILFRGKRCNENEWAYGFYVKADRHWHEHGVHKDWIVCGAISNGGWFNTRGKCAVEPETLGQYTGLKDKNGQRIFEGDVVTFKTTAYSFKPCIVEYRNDTVQFVVRKNDRCYPMDDDFIYEVIGNIHDDPELIGGVIDENA